jgi:hypothetical protein
MISVVEGKHRDFNLRHDASQQRGSGAPFATPRQERFAQGIDFTHHLPKRIDLVALARTQRVISFPDGTHQIPYGAQRKADVATDCDATAQPDAD